MFKDKAPIAIVLSILVLSVGVACGPAGTVQPTAAPISRLSGQIPIDGSSTVYPITEAVAEEFAIKYPNIRTTVGIKGTGGGFQVFCSENAAVRTAIQNASRAITAKEAYLCNHAGVEYTEFLIGMDGLTVAVNPANEFAACLTKEELNRIWDAGSTATNWNQVRADFPDRPLTLYGPGTDSGTFEFFTNAINGKAKQSRADYMASEDDNTLVQGVAGDENALGYFGLAYYLENADKLKSLQVDGGKGCVAPTVETVADGTYIPLSRPLYIYVNNADLKRPEVFEFTTFFLTNAKSLVDEVGFVSLDDNAYAAGLATLSGLE